MSTFHEFKKTDGTPVYFVTCDYTGESTPTYLALPKRAPAMFRGKHFANLMALLGFFWTYVGGLKNNATNAKRIDAARRWILTGFFGYAEGQINTEHPHLPPWEMAYYRDSLIRFGGQLDFLLWSSQWMPPDVPGAPAYNFEVVTKKQYTDYKNKLAGKFKSTVQDSVRGQKEATLDSVTVYPIQQEIEAIQTSYDRVKFPHSISQLVGDSFVGKITKDDVFIASSDSTQPSNANARKFLQEKGVLAAGQDIRGPMITFKKNRKGPRVKPSNSKPKSGDRLLKPKRETKATKKLSARSVGSGLARATSRAKVSKKRAAAAPTDMEINKTPSVIV